MSFDPKAFLDASTTEAAVVFTCPAGEYSPAVIQPGSIDLKDWHSQDGSKSGWKLCLRWEITDPALLSLVEGRDKVIVKQDIMLESYANGTPRLDAGMALKNLREALGLNTPGVAFAPRMLEGRMAKVRVKNTPYKDSIIAEVDGVISL